MKIKINQLTEGENSIDYQEPPSELALPEKHFDFPVILNGIIDKRGRNFYLKIKIETKGAFTCDRCLEIFERVFKSDIQLIFSQENYLQDERDEKDNFYIISEDTEEVDISQDIRDEILLGIPLKLICHKDCKGICPHCGAELNKIQCKCKKNIEDPRWESLKNIKFDE